MSEFTSSKQRSECEQQTLELESSLTDAPKRKKVAADSSPTSFAPKLAFQYETSILCTRVRGDCGERRAARAYIKTPPHYGMETQRL